MVWNQQIDGAPMPIIAYIAEITVQIPSSPAAQSLALPELSAPSVFHTVLELIGPKDSVNCSEDLPKIH